MTYTPTLAPVAARRASGTGTVDAPAAENNCISAWYADSVIFLTGSTGFVGKAVLEKLLRCCPQLHAVYVLVRAKKGRAGEERLRELFQNPVFDRIREKTPEYFEKVIAVPGDVCQPNLGICDSDRQILINTVTVAFHSAATVRFNEPLKDAVILNTLGTKRFLKLCKEMKKLKSVIHVSTAYSNCLKSEIDEMVYEPPFDPDLIIKCVQELPEDTLNSIADEIQGKHPNTYTLTKAMAEHIVLQNSSEFPIAIVRPSIVTSSWKDPVRGWIDNLAGVTGIITEMGRGTIRASRADANYIADIIPVDVLANTLVAVAWYNATNPAKSLRVFNCTSGSVNPITWEELIQTSIKHSVHYPSKYVTWYPTFSFCKSVTTYRVLHVVLHLFPSVVLDLVLQFSGRKPQCVRLCHRAKRALDTSQYFCTHQWRFGDAAMRQLIARVARARDADQFPCDVASHVVTWDDYIKDYVKGIRRYVLKDDDSTLKAARLKVKRLYWFKKILQFVSFFVFLRTIYALKSLLFRLGRGFRT